MYFVKGFYLALRIPAAGADEAAFLIGQQTTAVRALPGYVPGQAVVLRFIRSITIMIATITGITLYMFFQNAGNGIGAGEDSLTPFPGNGRAADAT